MTDIWDEMPKLVDPLWYDTVGENDPNSDRYYLKGSHDKDGTFDEAMDDWLEQLKTEHDKVKPDLVEWSRANNPEKEEKTPYDLWCSMNRLICKHFGTDWLEGRN